MTHKQREKRVKEISEWAKEMKQLIIEEDDNKGSIQPS